MLSVYRLGAKRHSIETESLKPHYKARRNVGFYLQRRYIGTYLSIKTLTQKLCYVYSHITIYSSPYNLSSLSFNAV